MRLDEEVGYIVWRYGTRGEKVFPLKPHWGNFAILFASMTIHTVVLPY